MSDGIVLVGLPGSGKSAVGRRLASLLDRPFIDIDEETHRLAGMPPAELIRLHGEQRLREIDQMFRAENKMPPPENVQQRALTMLNSLICYPSHFQGLDSINFSELEV